MNIVNGFLQRIKRGYLVESFLITQFLNKELAICIHRVFLNQVVFLGLPDLLAEFYPPVRQLEVDEDVVVGEGLACPQLLMPWVMMSQEDPGHLLEILRI